MRILHTADWHLGHTLHGYSREAEHRVFLDWLIDQLEEHEVDLLLVAGDLFDSANPPATAQAMYYSFLAEATRRCPKLEMVITAGNHDSPSRLEASSPLLRSFGVHVVGCNEKMALRIGDVACAAVPYLRPADLPNVEGDDPLVAGVRAVYKGVYGEVEKSLPLIVMGHAYLVGTQLSELSERKILGGNQHALPVDIFPEEAEYVALGHLHRPQSVGGRDRVRYSGSPIPLALDEGTYPHSVVLFELGGEIRTLRAPKSVEMIKLSAAPLDEILEEIELTPFEGNPFVEIEVLLEKPEPHLRHHLTQALKKHQLRLCKITPVYPGKEGKERLVEQKLTHLSPDLIFRRRHQQLHGSEPSPELLSCFHTLVEEVQQ